MKIRKVHTDGFRGLRDREYQLFDPRTDAVFDLVLVTGPRACGKTSFLEAILAGKERVAPYGSTPSATACLRRDAASAKVRIDWQLSRAEQERFGAATTSLQSEAMFGATVFPAPPTDPTLSALLGDYAVEPEQGKVEYFHASRRLPLGAQLDLSEAPGSDSDKMSRLRADDTKYSGIVRFLVEAGMGLDVDREGKPKAPGRVSRAFEALCPTKKIAGLYRAEDKMMPGFVDVERRTYGLAQLSDSELESLLFAGAFVRQGIAGSVVLIDTPEKHLGDADTRVFVERLLGLAADNQLIVATQSAALLASVRPEQVLRLG